MTYKVRWTQGREVWVRDLAGYSGKYVVFLGKHYASLQPEILMLLVKCQGRATVSLETHPLIVMRVSQCGHGPKIQRNIEFFVNILVFMFSSWQVE